MKPSPHQARQVIAALGSDKANLSHEVKRLRKALERIANSQPRLRRNGTYSAHDLEALQRTARTALA